MTISQNTTLSSLLKHEPAALEVIIGLSPKFTKLRSPLLRKLMAARTTIGMASRVGGCSPDDFFEALRPLGFIAEKSVEEEIAGKSPAPPGSPHLEEGKIATLDVRPTIDAGKDPFRTITEALKPLKAGEVLKLINSFEPTPLIRILEKQGYACWVEVVDENLVNTYFQKSSPDKQDISRQESSSDDWEEVMKRFGDKLVEVDVRRLEMPLPMMTILEALATLPEDRALFVHHKRIPVFLLPELAEKKFDFRTREISEGNVEMIIFRS